jgi:DNA-binding protein H-NS
MNDESSKPELSGPLQELQANLDELKAVKDERDVLNHRIAIMNSQIEMLETAINTCNSNITAREVERDRAVAERAVYEALFASIRAQLEAFEIPAAVLAETVNRANGKRKRIAEKPPAEPPAERPTVMDAGAELPPWQSSPNTDTVNE